MSEVLVKLTIEGDRADVGDAIYTLMRNAREAAFAHKVQIVSRSVSQDNPAGRVYAFGVPGTTYWRELDVAALDLHRLITEELKLSGFNTLGALADASEDELLSGAALDAEAANMIRLAFENRGIEIWQ